MTVEEKKKLKKLGQIVRAEREKQGLTLYDIENMGYSYYQHWQVVESGLKNITFTTLLAVCKVLKLHPSDLLRNI